jgi:hypothetical protein
MGGSRAPSLIQSREWKTREWLALVLRVDDFDETLSRARNLRLCLEEEPHINPGTKTLEFSLLDPDGYYVSISALATA